MAFWGVPWNRVVPGKGITTKPENNTKKSKRPNEEGTITARDFGGTAKWRTCYTSDGTGHTLLYTMDNEVVRLGVTVHDRVEVLALIHDGDDLHGRCGALPEDRQAQGLSGQGDADCHRRLRQAYRESTNAVI